jgi:N-formylglutamate deformylase
MCDVDRFVDRLYGPAALKFSIPIIVAKWHRYAVDLNRLPADVDASTVAGHANPPGRFNRGFHWQVTTKREVLMPKPISQELHRKFVERYFEPFHKQVQQQFDFFKSQGAMAVYHIDAHSMPSVGTEEHRDPGQLRPHLVISDVKGSSCSTEFKDLVIESYRKAGFDVGYNWPYLGGRITETYGRPRDGQHTIQVEMNRSLYMNEETKKIKQRDADRVKEQVEMALSLIRAGLPKL